MNLKTESTITLLAALLVLLAALMDPRVSAGVAIVLQIALSIYQFSQSRRPS